ncbi:MAG: nitroreductase family protein [Campylobacterota bacterium]|nr:nitroreductase family protein [Campylobacterota bacterium]
MPKFHQATNHSYLSVRKNAFFLDWQTQPSTFKSYPHFYPRFKISDYEELENLNLIGAITYSKEYPTGKHLLRSTPSAGALYPCELYIQIRGIKGLLNGIYHYEPRSATLVLLHELNRDGVEYYFPKSNKQKGLSFLISSIYFRSSWKYRDRAIRYILLDSGHQLGAIQAYCELQNSKSTIDFDFDKLALHDAFGFRKDEMFTASIGSTTPTDQEVSKLAQSLPYVAGSDYLENNSSIEEAYNQSAIYEDNPIESLEFFRDIDRDILKEAIIKRRSIRAFRMQSISKEEFDFIMEGLVAFASSHNIDLFYTIHRVKDMEQGLYQNGELISSGDFSQKSRYLSLEQNLGGQSAFTLYFSSSEVQKYQKVNILSGFIAHIIYLRSTIKDIGCSGIGAYYDEETQEFLKTQNNILYLLAVGR